MDEKFRVDFLTRQGLALCQKRGITIPRALMSYLIEWLLSSREGQLQKADDETTTAIYQSIFEEIFANGPTVRVLRLKYHFENNTTNSEAVRLKNELDLKNRLIPLTEYICGYTATDDDDFKELFGKIALYIIASNQLFNTKNGHMMAEAKAALQTIFTDHDIHEFVKRKKHFRIEYLRRIDKILCGILIFNKYTGLGGAGIRDVAGDAQLAYRNTVEAIRLKSVRCDQLILKGLEPIARIVQINPAEGKIIYKLPKNVELEDIRHFNKYNYIHLLLEIYLNRTMEPLKRVKLTLLHYIATINKTLNALEEVLKFRLAVPVELVFPHFAVLFESWHTILVHLQYLVHMNKFNDEMSKVVDNDYPFEEMAKKLLTPYNRTEEHPMPFDIYKGGESVVLRTRNRRASLFINPLQQFCALTLGLTGGLLIKSEVTFGVLPLFQQVITFKRKDYCAFAQKHYYKFTTYFLMTAFQNPEMCILFKIPQEFSPYKEFPSRSKTTVELFTVEKTMEAGVQTEHCVPPSTIAERNTYSWNVWDYRRRAIQLANLRNSQTHSCQTDITYHRRDAALQTYDKVSR